jgi:hypothetical protein
MDMREQLDTQRGLDSHQYSYPQTRSTAMKPNPLIALAATAGTIATQRLRGARLPLNPMTLRVLLAVAVAALGVLIAPPASADTGCGPGGPPPGAASKDISDVYGQRATLWLTNLIVGISTDQGYGEQAIQSPSPIERRALLIDAQQDGSHQIIVDAGREAHLYTVSGCTIRPVIDQAGACLSYPRCKAGDAPFLFDRGHRRGNGDGVGCSDLGDGPHLVALLQLRDEQGKPLLTVRRTEIDLNGATATIGRSDTVTATSDHDPAWTTAGDISCGDLTIEKDGIQAPH